MTKYVIVQKCGAEDTNGVFSDSWIETKIFDENATLKEVMLWKQSKGYRCDDTIITKPDEEINHA